MRKVSVSLFPAQQYFIVSFLMLSLCARYYIKQVCSEPECFWWSVKRERCERYLHLVSVQLPPSRTKAKDSVFIVFLSFFGYFVYVFAFTKHKTGVCDNLSLMFLQMCPLIFQIQVFQEESIFDSYLGKYQCRCLLYRVYP